MKKIMNRKTIILFFFGIILINCTTFLCAAKTFDVGKGQTYSTTGTNDQTAINNAISTAISGDTVYLHAGNYRISAPINVNSKNNIIIKGDGPQNTIIQASSYGAFLGSGHMSMIQIGRTTNSELYGFTIKGTSPQIQPEVYDGNPSNDDSENGMNLYSSSSNNRIHDLYFTLLSGDGIYGTGSNNNSVYNCIFNTDMHDCIQLWGVSNWHIYNCLMTVTSDCGVRFQGSRDCKVDHCTMNVPAGLNGNGGVYFQNSVSGITVDHNIFKDMTYNIIGAIYDRSAEGESTSGKVTVSNNVFYKIMSNKFIVCPAVTITQSGNQYPSSVSDWSYWTNRGYGYS